MNTVICLNARGTHPRVAKEIRVYFLLYWCMRKCNMTVLGLNKVILAHHTQNITSLLYSN